MNIPPTPILLRCRANELNQCPILVGVMRMTKKSATKWAAVTILLVSFAQAIIYLAHHIVFWMYQRCSRLDAGPLVKAQPSLTLEVFDKPLYPSTALRGNRLVYAIKPRGVHKEPSILLSV